MINFTRHIIAAPLRVLVWVIGILPIIDRRALMEAIWFLTGDPDDGVAVVALISQSKGIEAARKRAANILEKSRSAKVAAIIGFVEMNENSDSISARSKTKVLLRHTITFCRRDGLCLGGDKRLSRRYIMD